jgi:hypothetical protein
VVSSCDTSREQLTPCPIGSRQGVGTRGQVVGHRVEGAGNRGNLVAATVGRAGG